jgi:hypothetical protein
MNRKAVLVLGIAALALAGCSANHTTSTVTNGLTPDQQAVTTTIGSVPELLDDGLSDAGGAAAGFSSRPDVGPLTPIAPEGSPDPPAPSPGPRVERRFWRVITSIERSVDYTLADPDDAGHPRSAHVVVHKHMSGEFHVQFVDTIPSSTGGDSIVVRQVVKPLRDHWVRHVWLVRRAVTGETDDTRHGWRVTALSGIEVRSEIEDGGQQPHIESIRLQTGERDTTLTDPAAAIHWRDLWHVPGSAPVQVTVTTDQPDDVVLLVHRDHRLRLVPNGDNTYSGSWNATAVAGLKHFGVNAMSQATLMDSEDGYHSDAWFYPFVNDGESVTADDAP